MRSGDLQHSRYSRGLLIVFGISILYFMLSPTVSPSRPSSSSTIINPSRGPTNTHTRTTPSHRHSEPHDKNGDDNIDIDIDDDSGYDDDDLDHGTNSNSNNKGNGKSSKKRELQWYDDDRGHTKVLVAYSYFETSALSRENAAFFFLVTTSYIPYNDCYLFKTCGSYTTGWSLTIFE
jgi:hypothetical protein